MTVFARLRAIAAAGDTSLRLRIMNRLVQSLPIAPRRRVSYALAHHRLLSLAHPVRYSEKLNWRMVFDRRELMVIACDKLAMKAYAAQRVESSRLRIPQTLWVGTDVTELTDVALPAHWVLKPNSGTGQVFFGAGAADLHRVRPLAASWLADHGLARWGEWGYGRAERTLLVEERIDRAESQDLWDWKFFVFAGRPLVVQVDSGRAGDHRRRLYTPDWLPLPHRTGRPLAEPVDPPEQLAQMLEVAAALGAEYDHIRVDLYVLDGEIWFGELTPYSGSGVVSFEPDDLDFTLGAAWTLPHLTEPPRSR